MLGLIHNTQYKYRKAVSGCCVLGLIHNTQYKYREAEWVLCVRVDSQYSVQVQKGCEWLVAHRLIDGGWGENFESCELKHFVPAERSQVVQTAWALLALMAVRSVILLLSTVCLSVCWCVG